jgi:hypothetical protein
LPASSGALRVLPEIVSHLLHGERPPHAPESMRLREFAEMSPQQGGLTLLGERPGEEIALGLVGRFWRPVIQYEQVGADRFLDFDEPGYAKTVYGSLANGTMVAACPPSTGTSTQHASTT